MSSILIPVLGFLFVFGLVVFIHEFGHFIAAKWNDVEVEAFSLGMGPSLLAYTYGETEYRICVLPLGGYVKMAGEELDEREEEDDNPRAFHNKSVGGRLAILVAGAAFNILLGYVLYVPYGMVEGESVSPAKVGHVPETITIADDDGDTTTVPAPAHGKLQVNDRIISLNGTKVETFRDITRRNLLLGDKTREFLVRRDGEQRIVRIDPVRTVTRQFNQPKYVVGISAYIDGQVDAVRDGSQAAEAGVEKGYRVSRIGDTPVANGTQFQTFALNQSGTVTIGFTGEEGRDVGVTTYIPETDQAFAEWISRFGVVLNVPTKRYGFIESFGYAWTRTLADIQLMYDALVGLISQRLSPKSLAGPVGIVQMTSQMALIGFWPLIRFTALFSINLGVVNLLPIPVLDGGHILLTLPEVLTGKKLPRKTVEMAHKVGFILIIGLFLFVTYYDLLRLNLFEGIFNLFGI
jgi:regulator of sigma E protease